MSVASMLLESSVHAVLPRRLARPAPEHHPCFQSARRVRVTRLRAESSDNAEQSTSSSSANSTSTAPAGKGFGKKPPPAAPKKESNPKAAAAASPAKSSAAPAVVRRAAPQQPLLGKQENETLAQTETAIVATLGLIFVIILCEGIFLAAAGFLPEEWDAFALDSIYPAFSPTVGLFILLAAGYGLLKFLGPQQK